MNSMMKMRCVSVGESSDTERAKLENIKVISKDSDKIKYNTEIYAFGKKLG